MYWYEAILSAPVAHTLLCKLNYGNHDLSCFHQYLPNKTYFSQSAVNFLWAKRKIWAFLEIKISKGLTKIKNKIKNKNTKKNPKNKNKTTTTTTTNGPCSFNSLVLAKLQTILLHGSSISWILKNIIKVNWKVKSMVLNKLISISHMYVSESSIMCTLLKYTTITLNFLWNPIYNIEQIVAHINSDRNSKIALKFK